jgi:hypothetical protein
MKKCPFCAEDIQDAAIVCKHCHSDLAPPKAATIACPFCKALVAKNSKVCPACGDDISGVRGAPAGASPVQPVAPKKKTSFVTWAVFGFIVLGVVGWFSRSTPPTPTPIARTTAPAVPEDARKLATAKLAGTADWSDPAVIARLCEESDMTLGKVTSNVISRCATAHLAVMRDLAKAGKGAGARKAFNLASNEGASPAALASSEKLLKTAEDAELKRKQGADAAEKTAARLAYAKVLRERYLDQNMDIKVSVTGNGNDRLTMQFALFNDVWANKFQKGDLYDAMRLLGFHRVYMTDGYDYHVYWNFK